MLTPATQTSERHTTRDLNERGSHNSPPFRSPTTHIIAAVLVCILLASVTTAYEVYEEHREQRLEVSAQHNAILHLDTLPLIHGIAEGESHHTQEIIDNIAALHPIDEVILDRWGQVTLQAGELVREPLQETVSPLTSFREGGHNYPVGFITLRTDSAAFRQQLTATIWLRLLDNLLRMAAMAVLVAMLYYVFVGRHLQTLTHALRQNRSGGESNPIALPDSVLNAPPAGLRALASALSNTESNRVRERAQAAARLAALETDNAALRQQLREQAPLVQLGSQAGTVIHEVRSPLAAIRAAHQLLSLQLGNAEPAVHETLRRVGSNTERLDHLLRLSRDMVTGSASENTTVELNAWVEQFVDAAVVPADFKLCFTPSPSALYTEIDPIKVEQILKNLIDNAAQAMHEALGPDAPTSTQVWGIGVQVSVVDTHTAGIYITDCGGGMQPEVSGRLFDPLFTTKSDGLGMGLPISVRLAELLGGSLTLTSTAEGTTACLTLPRTSHSDN